MAGREGGMEEGGDAALAWCSLQDLAGSKPWMQKSGQQSPACCVAPEQLTAGRSPLGMKTFDGSLNESTQ